MWELTLLMILKKQKLKQLDYDYGFNLIFFDTVSEVFDSYVHYPPIYMYISA